MNWYINIIAALALIAVGWFAHDAHIEKERADATQKAETRYQKLESDQEDQRSKHKAELAEIRRNAEQRFGKLVAENNRLRAETIAPVPVAFLILGGLCGDAAECALFHFAGTDKAATAPEGYSTVTAVEIYRLLGAIDDALLAHNLGLSQLQDQLNVCRGQ